jgi:hypothetical protein
MADSSQLRKLPMEQGRPTRWGLNHGPVARHERNAQERAPSDAVKQSVGALDRDP